MIDFACRMKPSWAKVMRRWQNNRPAWVSLLKLLVPWWHGLCHTESCQLGNSARYAVGMGRRIGETEEQIWSQTKVCDHCIAMQVWSHHCYRFTYEIKQAIAQTFSVLLLCLCNYSFHQ
jgi:hypothetical protein